MILGTPVRFPMGAPTKIHLEPHQLGVEQFLEMLRFEQRRMHARCGHSREHPASLCG